MGQTQITLLTLLTIQGEERNLSQGDGSKTARDASESNGATRRHTQQHTQGPLLAAPKRPHTRIRAHVRFSRAMDSVDTREAGSEAARHRERWWPGPQSEPGPASGAVCAQHPSNSATITIVTAAQASLVANSNSSHTLALHMCRPGTRGGLRQPKDEKFDHMSADPKQVCIETIISLHTRPAYLQQPFRSLSLVLDCTI
jgi:hypothetical protein